MLVVLDLSQSRFWTGFEAYLACQQVTPEGLRPAIGTERRCEVVCVHNAEDSLRDVLFGMWATKSLQEAHQKLGKPDITVTNMSDKQTQLVKLLTLNEQIKNDFRELSIRERAQAADPLYSGSAARPQPATPPPQSPPVRKGGKTPTSKSPMTPPASSQPMDQWSVDEVMSFVKSLKLPESVCHAFEENAIDGEMLLGLSEADLKQELGMKKLQIDKLQREVSRIKSALSSGEYLCVCTGECSVYCVFERRMSLNSYSRTPVLKLIN